MQKIKSSIDIMSSIHLNPGEGSYINLNLNLANAYRHLANHENRSENLARARALAAAALNSLGEEDRPADRGEALYALGQVDIAVGQLADNADTKQAVQEWACAFDIFVRAGMNQPVDMVLNGLRQIPPAIVRSALREPSARPDCHWDAGKLLSLAGAA